MIPCWICSVVLPEYQWWILIVKSSGWNSWVRSAGMKAYRLAILSVINSYPLINSCSHLTFENNQRYRWFCCPINKGGQLQYLHWWNGSNYEWQHMCLAKKEYLVNVKNLLFLRKLTYRLIKRPNLADFCMVNIPNIYSINFSIAIGTFFEPFI